MPVVFSLPDTVPDRMENESVPPQNYILPVHTPDESPPAEFFGFYFLWVFIQYAHSSSFTAHDAVIAFG